MRAQLRRLTERPGSGQSRRPHSQPRKRPDAPADAAPQPPREPEQRVRGAGGPRDVAHYTCECGYVFEATVSTSVACPHCGQGQAW